MIGNLGLQGAVQVCLDPGQYSVKASEEKGLKNQIGQAVCFLLFTRSLLIRKLHAHSMSLEPTISSSTLFY